MPKCGFKTRYFPAIFAWTIFLTTTALFFYYPCRYFIYRFPWIPLVEGIIAFFVLANFSLATFMDPGIIPKAPPDEDRDDDFRAPLYKNVDISGITVRMKWCVTCKFYRPPRCSHCSVCNHCIETFDHHCPWMNNCIGRRNYRFFFFFLISLSLHMISVFSVCLFYVLKHKDKIKGPDVIVSLSIMILVIVLVIPIFGLTGFHMVLVSRGRTTNEQVTGKFKGGYNPFSRGCFRNCCYIQCGPHYPSITNPKKLRYKRRRRQQNVSEPIATITNDNQVKTYMETANSNGTRNIVGSHSYNKLSPRRETNTLSYDIDMEPTASSQSMDCEATPPSLQRQGSKSNFMKKIGNSDLIESSHYRLQQSNIRNSPHPKHRTNTLDQKPRVYVSNDGSNANDHSRSLLSMQQRIKAMGVPTPILMSSSPIKRSNPGTPTQVRRPDFISTTANNKPTVYEFPSKSTVPVPVPLPVANQYYRQQQYQTQPQQPLTKSPYNSSGSNQQQRRFVSETELLSQNQQSRGPATSHNNADNIRELVSSPQKSMYIWKDNAPATFNYGSSSAHEYPHSNPTSPTQVTHNRINQKQYHPAIRGGVAVYPQGSPQPYRKTQMLQSHTLPDNRRRPMSFAKALEMSDCLEMLPISVTATSTETTAAATSATTSTMSLQTTTTPTTANSKKGNSATPDRSSVYDMNYEISV